MKSLWILSAFSMPGNFKAAFSQILDSQNNDPAVGIGKGADRLPNVLREVFPGFFGLKIVPFGQFQSADKRFAIHGSPVNCFRLCLGTEEATSFFNVGEFKHLLSKNRFSISNPSGVKGARKKKNEINQIASK